MTKESVCIVYPSIVAPIVLCTVSIYFGLSGRYWILCCIPFIILGSLCSAPNLNLADGCLAIISILLGLVIAAWILLPLGTAICMGSGAGLICGAIEKRIRLKPYTCTSSMKDT